MLKERERGREKEEPADKEKEAQQDSLSGCTVAFKLPHCNEQHTHGVGVIRSLSLLLSFVSAASLVLFPSVSLARFSFSSSLQERERGSCANVDSR